MPTDGLGPYTLGRVYQGDARTLLAEIPDGSVTMVFTDPPYGHHNNDGDLAHRLEAALGLGPAGDARPILGDGPEATPVLRDVLDLLPRVMRPDCCCCCCCGGGGGPDPQFARWALLLDTPPWTFFHAVVWDKGGLGLGWRYRRNYELVLIAHLRRGRLAWAWAGSGRETANVVRFGKTIPRADQHPTPKPIGGPAVTVVLPRTPTEDARVTEIPGTWSRWRDRVYVCCPRCGRTCRIDHRIAEDGTLTQSLVCPGDGCDWHVWVRLAEWSGGEESQEAAQ